MHTAPGRTAGGALRLTAAGTLALLLAATPGGADPAPPYRELSRAGADFPGPGRDAPAPARLEIVRVGLLGPGRGAAGARLREGADLAVDEANARGGLFGVPYEVVFRPDDGPWGVGAQQVTALAYDDSVWAVVGGLEGGNAHLAELVAAKLWIPVVTPTAADFTIDYANVPWVFRYAPSDRREVAALFRYAAARGVRRVTAYVEDDREGRTGLRRLEDAAREGPVSIGVSRSFRAHLAAEAVRGEDLAGADAVVIWTRAETGRAVLAAVRKAGFDGLVLAPAVFLSADASPPSPPGTPGDVVVAAPCDPDLSGPRLRPFAERYRAAYGRDPDPVAILAYDATRLVLDAIERAGLNRARIRDALAASDFRGLAGPTRFDALGGAEREPVLVAWRGGNWEPLDGGDDVGGSGTGRHGGGRSAGGEPSAGGR